MQQHKLGDMERKLAEILWENEPLQTAELVKICEKEFTWKRTTTYTMLKRLCEREIFLSENGTVTSLIKQTEYLALQGECFLNDTFGGSLPQFIAAFARRKALSGKEIAEIEKLIAEFKEE